MADAQCVITMLPDGEAVAAVHRQVLASAPADPRLFLDCSTIDVTTTRHLAAQARDAGLGFVDAPVSGGPEGARGGGLSFMVGGRSEDVAEARPILEALGQKIITFGEAGAGQAAKACHNMICGITALGVCEAFALAEALGLDHESFFALCQGAAAQSWILENRCPVPGPAPAAPASNDYAPGFAARLMAKDLRLAQAAAEASGQGDALRRRGRAPLHRLCERRRGRPGFFGDLPNHSHELGAQAVIARIIEGRRFHDGASPLAEDLDLEGPTGFDEARSHIAQCQSLAEPKAGAA